ncbi:glycosyltransferase family 2 protein [Gordonia alkanivorans]|uniref:glycosyltransferase family 2 protein n=1 Tax=Gordonia alkanivorans TaxID=84096 RepID=UPI003D2364C1
MIGEPLVSVVVPVHNAEKYLTRALPQLAELAKSTDLEVIVIDDNSSDRSAEIVRSWIADTGIRADLYHATFRGVANARNEAIGFCNGRYVWFADIDDSWDADVLIALSGVAEAEHADIVVCNAVKVTDDGIETGIICDAPHRATCTGEQAFSKLLNGCLQGHLWNKLFRRELLGEDPFPPLRAHSDLGGLLHLMRGNQRIAFLPRILYTYRQNPGSILNSGSYPFDGLVTCLEIAESRSTLPGSNARSLMSFRYRVVAVPLLNELARRRSKLSEGERAAVVRMLRQTIRWRDARYVLSSGRDIRNYLQALVGKLSPSIYFGLYSFARHGRLTLADS